MQLGNIYYVTFPRNRLHLCNEEMFRARYKIFSNIGNYLTTITIWCYLFCDVFFAESGIITTLFCIFN